jgi:hypothetical protein
MAIETVRKDDEGTEFIVTFTEDDQAVDISAATTTEIVFKSPDGTVTAQDASFVTDGTDGKLTYTTSSGDIDKEGLWLLQGHIVTPSGEWRTEMGKFHAREILE